MRSSKIIINIIAKRYSLKMVLDIDFMTLNVLKDFFFFHIPWICYELEGTTRGVQCIKHVRVYVSAQEGVWFGPCRITYTYNKHI